VIGMTVVLADGRVIKVGGKVVKNVAGYDLSKLFTGSYGTLGVITELTFKLRPLPAVDATAALHGPGDSLFSIASSINQALLSPVAMEIMSGEIMSGDLQDAGANVLLVRFAASEEAVSHQLRLTRQIAAQHKEVWMDSNDNSEQLWRSVATAGCGSSKVVARVVVTPSSVMKFVKLLGPDEAWQAGAGTGVIRILTAATQDLNLAERLSELRAQAAQLGGTLVIEGGSQDLRLHLDSWGGFNSASLLIGRIKQQLDPANILSPGRF
jgi:glycolate oxidase FAD binding subunit